MRLTTRRLIDFDAFLAVTAADPPSAAVIDYMARWRCLRPPS
jgi:hypothetical protein